MPREMDGQEIFSRAATALGYRSLFCTHDNGEHTRRSYDPPLASLQEIDRIILGRSGCIWGRELPWAAGRDGGDPRQAVLMDHGAATKRSKSTRLNSSH